MEQMSTLSKIEILKHDFLMLGVKIQFKAMFT